MNGLGHLYNQLCGRLWHTTHPDLVPSIVEKGGLLVEPDLPDVVRWGTSGGSETYPFVRSIGGVSLFDFGGFDQPSYVDALPSLGWHTFVPHRDDWRGAVWIEIDRATIATKFVSVSDLRDRWDEVGSRHRNLIPMVEAAHLGDLPIAAFQSAFMTWGDGRHAHPLDLNTFDQTLFDRFRSSWNSYLEENPDPLAH